jgi:hypothetical protein
MILPCRNEEYLHRTVQDIFEKAKGDTEVIVVLDGYWPEPPLKDHPKLTVVHPTDPVGQRGGMNLGARISKAKYVMKADGHCSFDEGFDVKLMADCEYDWTVVPMMYHLHIFDWKCMKCGRRQYQGPQPKECPICKGTDLRMRHVWKPRRGTRRYQMRFDSELIFQYWNERHQIATSDLVETMSFIGAGWFMHRDRYWELEGLDEGHGFWGNVGTEVSCKTWLSGGKLIVNKKTFFSHFFRTQFGWPYPITQGQINRAREYSRDLWLNNKWKGQKYPLSWLIDKFWPIPGWSEEDRRNLSMKPFPFSASSNDNISVGNISPVVSDLITNGTPAWLANNLVGEDMSVRTMGLPIVDESESSTTLNHVSLMGDKS